MSEAMRDFDDKLLKKAENEQANENVTGDSPSVSPATAGAMLSRKMAGVQRRALVEGVAQTYGNRQVQRMLNNVRRSASSGPEGGPLEDDLAGRIQAERANGDPMPSDVRREVEGSLGQDLSPVRVHTGSASAELNRAMGAKAFTSGRDIFYGDGNSPSDIALTTHEATHTVQQGFSEEAPKSIGAADTEHEHAAEAASSGAAEGVQRESEEEEVAMMRDPSVQREGEEEEVAMMRDPAVQREGEEDEIAMKRDDAVQREGEEEEIAMKRDDAVMREGEEEEMSA
jgi:Domain of unknown function (DUF4157)